MDDLATINACYRVIGVLYVQLITRHEMTELLTEYYGFLNDCFANKRGAYKTLLEELASMTFYRGFRTRVLSTMLRVLSHFDAFIAGLLYNEMPDALKAKIGEYRIFRDDYSTVKALFQDLFEITSQLLIFFGAIVNLSLRNDPWQYANGASTFNSFKKQVAFERFKILSEAPKLLGIVGAINRPMRNSIGHFSADYDPKTGNLRYDDGSEENYLVFLGEFLTAVKAHWFTLIVVEKMDIDMNRLGVE